MIKESRQPSAIMKKNGRRQKKNKKQYPPFSISSPQGMIQVYHTLYLIKTVGNHIQLCLEQ